MSKKIATIKCTGKNSYDLDITRFVGPDKKGIMLQLTQGLCGYKVFGKIKDEPGYIQLTKQDTYQLILELTKWLMEMDI